MTIGIDSTEQFRLEQIQALEGIKLKLEAKALSSLDEFYHVMSGLNFAHLDVDAIVEALELDKETVFLVLEGENTQMTFDLIRISNKIVSLITEQLTNPAYAR